MAWPSSLLFSNPLDPSLWPSTTQTSLKTSSFSLSRAPPTASPRVKNCSFKKKLFWVSRANNKKHPVLLSSKRKLGVSVCRDSSNGYPEYGRLLPCLSHGRPRVEHLVVSEGGAVLDYISKALHLPPLYVADLIQFGAVHYALVSPKPPPSATPEQFRVYKEVTDPSVLEKRASIKGKTVGEAQKTFRITDVNEFVEAGAYLRVYVHPRRFPRSY